MNKLQSWILKGLWFSLIVVSTVALGPQQVCEPAGIAVGNNCGVSPGCPGTGCTRNWNDCHTCNSGYGNCLPPLPGTSCTTRRETTGCVPLLCWCWALGWTTVPGTTLLLPETCL